MKKYVIYYFSGTGNTWWVADRLRNLLLQQGNEVGMLAIETLSYEDVIKQVKECDHIIIGFAVTGSTAHINMRRFVKDIPSSDVRKPVSVYGTHALASGDSAWHIGSMLVEKGYELRHAVQIRMMNNFHLPKFRFTKPDNGERLERLLNRAEVRVEALAQAIINDKPVLRGNHLIAHMVGGFQRSGIDSVVKSLYKDFGVDHERCIDCGRCVRICPVKNIYKAEGTYHFDERCVLCMRCYHQCPKSAIYIGRESLDERKYPRYRGPSKGFKIEDTI